MSFKSLSLKRLTKDYNSGSGAPSFSHDVAGRTGVVSRIRETSVWDDQIMIPSGVRGRVSVQGFVVFQPFHLEEKKLNQKNC